MSGNAVHLKGCSKTQTKNGMKTRKQLIQLRYSNIKAAEEAMKVVKYGKNEIEKFKKGTFKNGDVI